MTWIQPPPPELGEGARKYWERLAAGCSQGGFLTPQTVEAFKLLCRLLATADSAGDAIERSGAVIESASGAQKANPGVKILTELQPRIDALLSQFGIEHESALLRKWP